MDSQKQVWESVDFAAYFAFVWWWVVVVVIVELVFRFWSAQLDGGLVFERREMILWFWRLVFFVFLGWRVGKTFEPHWIIGAISGAVAGFLIGLISAFWRFYDGLKIWKFFNLLTESVLVLLFGAVVAALAIWAFYFRQIKNN